MINQYNLDWRAGLLFVLSVVFGVALIMLCMASANAQTCTAGQSPVWTANGWTCASPAVQPLPVGSAVNMTIANAGATGTTVNRLAKLTGAPSTAVITATTDTEGAIGVCTANCGTTGTATVAILGQVTCDFDGATTAGNYVTISAITAGQCHDAGSAFPTSGATYGRVLSTNGGAGAYVMELMTPDIAFQNAGGGKSKPGGSSGQVQYHGVGNVFAGASQLTYADAPTGIALTQGVVKLTNSSVPPLDIATTTTIGVGSDVLRMGNNGTLFLQATPSGIILTQPTLTANNPVFTTIGTWNNAGVIFQNLKTNITDTASPTQASLIDLQIGSASKFLVYKSGIIANAGIMRVTAQFDKTNATLANVTGLTNNVAHTKSYSFIATLYYDADVTGGAKFAIGGTATGTVIYQINTICNATNLNVLNSRQVAIAGSAGQAGCTAGYTIITGTLTTTAGSGGGTLTVQFAQNAANGTSNVLVGSTFEIREILP